MAEFFETRIKNMERSIPPSVPSRNNRKSKKGFKKRKLVTFVNSDYDNSDQGKKGEKVLSVPWHKQTYHGLMHHS